MRVAIISSLVSLLCVGLIGAWLLVMVERQILTIEASVDVPEQGIPIYGERVVTQTVTFAAATQLSHLSIPLYAPLDQGVLTVQLLSSSGTILGSWRYEPQQGYQVLELSLGQIRVPAGQLAITLSTRHVSPPVRENAPRVFVETEDDNYVGGNYRIAQNEKKGDIALSLRAKVPRWHLWRERFLYAPLSELRNLAMMVSAILLLGTTPYVIVSLSGKRSRFLLRSR